MATMPPHFAVGGQAYLALPCGVCCHDERSQRPSLQHPYAGDGAGESVARYRFEAAAHDQGRDRVVRCQKDGGG